MNEKRDSFINVDIPITAAEIAERRQNTFNKKLEEKQQEFNINTTKPKDINFADQYDGPIGSEMDNMVADAIAKREKELNLVLHNQDSAEGNEWINKDIPKAKHIKIGEQLNDKHVTFDIKEHNKDESTNFLSLLKKKSTPKPKKELSVDDRLRIIERNQTSIMNILSNILETLQSN